METTSKDAKRCVPSRRTSRCYPSRGRILPRLDGIIRAPSELLETEGGFGVGEAVPICKLQVQEGSEIYGGMVLALIEVSNLTVMKWQALAVVSVAETFVHTGFEGQGVKSGQPLLKIMPRRGLLDDDNAA